MSGTTQLTLNLSNSLEALSDLEAAIDKICQANHVERKHWHRCRLVGEELFVNIITHGFDAQTIGSIEWVIQIRPNEIHFDIHDNGRVFAPRQPKPLPASLDEIEDVGGHGTGLIAMMTRSIDYSRKDDLNRCQVVMDA